jgi:hypothetical protein
VSIAFLCLILLIGMAPAVLFLDGPLWLGAWSGIVSFALAIVARAIRPGEAAHLGMLVRPLAVAATIPAIVMLLQAAPLPDFFRVNNAIWESAATALGRPLFGSISIDTGSTLLSLCRYGAWLGLGLLTTAVTIDRQRAEWTLFAATGATAAMSMLLIVNDLGGFTWLDRDHATLARGGALDSAALGLILSATCADRAYERFETRQDRSGQSVLKMVRNIVMCTAAFVICAVAMSLSDSDNTLFAAAAGMAALLGIVLVRRLALGSSGALAIAVIGCAVTAGIVGMKLRRDASDLTLSFAAQSSPSKAITQRILADSTWLGTGAGTYQMLMPIYREHNDVMSRLEPPTAAAEIAVEAGRPLLWLGVLAGVAIILILVRGGLRRGRDSFYSAAGAGTLVALLITAFGNAGLFGSAIQIISGAVLGLAFAQRQSRTVQ